MSVDTSPTPVATEFHARLTEFRRIARAWSALLVVVVAAGTVMQFLIGEITDQHPWSLWVLGVSLLAAFTVAVLRIFFSYQRLFVCPACKHQPRNNDLSAILLGVWGMSSLNPTSCVVCGAVLRQPPNAL